MNTHERPASEGLIIGIDAGTSVIKAVAFDLDGRQIDVASTPNTVDLGAHGVAEQDMLRTWRDTAATLRLLSQKIPDLARRTHAVAVTGQGDGAWLIDGQGEPVGPAMLWLDGRASTEIAALQANGHAAAIAARTGTALNPAMQSGQLRWLHHHQSERLDRARTALHCKDWLYFKLCGERATCSTEGTFTFGHYAHGAYDDEVLELLGLSSRRHLLPAIVVPGSHHAPLNQTAAAETGLLEGTPIVLGPMDVPATLMGGGGVAHGPQGLRNVGCSVLGSTGMHGWSTQGLERIHPSAEAGYTMMLPIPDVRMRIMSHMAATLNVDWLLSLMGQVAQFTGGALPPRGELLDGLNRMVLEAAPAQAFYHPYIADNGERGPFVDPHARAQLSGFSSTLGLPGMARAVFEGIAYATRDCYAALGDLPEEVRLTGGAARSPALRQLLANIMGKPVRVSHREECGAAGTAVMAAVALGHYPDVRAALPDWVDTYLDAAMTQPDPAQAALYERLFPLYQQSAAASRPLSKALIAARRGPA